MKRSLQTPGYNSLTAWLLVVVFVSQSLFPLQLHTQTALTSSGRTVLLCTLNGLKSVVLDEQGLISDKDYQESQALTPAIQFSQLTAFTTPAIPPVIIPPTNIPDLTPVGSTVTTVTLVVVNRQSIRAPPAV